MVFGHHTVKPDRSLTRTDVTMDGLTFDISMHTPSIKSEGADEEIVSR
jgi:hypothetical protein